jgi:hypothetical protein
MNFRHAARDEQKRRRVMVASHAARVCIELQGSHVFRSFWVDRLLSRQ